MGLADILRGMRNGPRGERPPNSGSGWGSRLMMAILGIMAFKMFTGRSQDPRTQDPRNPDPRSQGHDPDADTPPPPRRRWL